MPTLAEQGWAPVACVDLATGEAVAAMPVVGPIRFLPPSEDPKGGEPGAIRFHEGAKGWIVRRKDGCWFGVLSADRSRERAASIEVDRIKTKAEIARLKAEEEARVESARLAEIARVETERVAEEERVAAEAKKAEEERMAFALAESERMHAAAQDPRADLSTMPTPKDGE